jgi:hypothetical protein
LRKTTSAEGGLVSEKLASRNSLLLFSMAIAIMLLSAVVQALGLGGVDGTVAASDLQEMAVVGISAAVILSMAQLLDRHSAFGRPWFLIGLGAASYAIGDTVWALIEVLGGREVPYPGLPDLFYLAEYPLFAIGIVSAGLAYKRLVDLRRPIAISALFGVAVSTAVFLGIVWPTVLQSPDISPGEKVLSTIYPMGDVLLMMTPAVFVILVVSQLGNRRFSHPWYAVAAGVTIIAASDAVYSWLSAYNLYASGSPIDLGWSTGHALIMFGALVARDIAESGRD